MSRRRNLFIWLLCVVASLTLGTVEAGATSGGATPGRTDIIAGVSVDYMGKLRFVVVEKRTDMPIEGASIEIYIKSLKRFVLVGMTDSSGEFELDMAYNMDRRDLHEGNQLEFHDGMYSFNGSLLYLNSNQVMFNAYKAGYLLNPYRATVELELKEIPQVVTVRLYKEGEAENKDDDPEPGGGGGSGSTNQGGNNGEMGGNIGSVIQQMLSILDDMVPLGGIGSDGIPKTGVEGAVPYWLLGLVFFLFAGGMAWKLLTNEKKIEGAEGGE